MEKEKIKETLSQAFNEVMEGMLFMFPDSLEKDEAAVNGSTLMASIRFSGHLNGDIKLTVQTGLCKEFAANMLGIESADEESLQKSEDALKEILNTVCGRFLTTLAGDEPVFNLSPPVVDEIDSELWKEIKEKNDTLCFNVEEEPVLVLVDMDQPG